MKKLFLAVLSVLLIFSMVSCDSTETNAEGYVYIPEFYASKASEKGLTFTSVLTNGSAIEDPAISTAVLQTMPVMSNLKAVKFNQKQIGKKVHTVFDIDSTYYPMGVKVVMRDNSELKKDGIYCYYDVMENNQRVGFVDYYYNFDTLKFTYRQYLIFTIDPNNSILLALEYNDVAATLDQATDNAIFKVGGINKYNAFFDVITLGKESSDDERIGFTRNYIIAKSEKHDFASIVRPDEEISTFYSRSPEYGQPKLKQVYNLFNSATDLDVNLALNLGKLVYESMSGENGIAAHVWNSENSYRKYDKYEDYQKLSLAKTVLDSTVRISNTDYPTLVPYYNLSNNNLDIDCTIGNNGNGDNATVYRFHGNDKLAASTRYYYLQTHSLDHSTFFGAVSNKNFAALSGTALRGHALILNTFASPGDNTAIKNETYNLGLGDTHYVAPRDMFENFYPSLKSITTSSGNSFFETYYKTLVKEHLKKCGVDDEYYAENFWYSELKHIVDKDGNIYFCSKVTNENPAEFKTKHDARREELMNRYSNKYLSSTDYDALKMGQLAK